VRTRRRATATSAATTSRCTSPTSTAADLRRRGLRVLGEPTAGTGAHAGQRWVYFLSPWVMQFELVSYPGGKAYDRDPGAFA
jgi:hypothetical protein